MTLNVESTTLEDSGDIQVFLVVVCNPTTSFVLRSAESGCIQQDARTVIGCDDDIFVVGGSELSPTQIHVRAARLRGDDRHGLSRRPVDVAEKAGNADLAF